VPTSRRQVLRTAWKFGAALLGAAATWTTWEALRPLASRATGAKVRVGDAGAFAVGTATYVPEGRLYIVNADSQYFALSQKCPHLGCRVPFCESSGRFECGCHGSIFNLAGEWQAGPAPRGLDRYALTADGTALVVDTGALTNGPDRGSRQFDLPATGPACETGA
jgi:Rieske Fe-S protein